MNNNKITGLGIFLLSLFSFVGLFYSCGSRDTNGRVILHDKEETISPLELPMPVIPDSLKDSEARRIYAGIHFWDNLNFRDTVLSLNQDFME